MDTADEISTEKLCQGRCGLVKPIGEFHPHSRDGYRSRCKDCDRLDKLDRRHAAPQKHRAASLRWARAHPEHHNRIVRASYARRHGWTLGEKRCACGEPIPDRRQKCDACKGGRRLEQG
ncbi:MAG: hypothetical protein ACRDNZ_00730 [Streptosporangiaceae bacterium]